MKTLLFLLIAVTTFAQVKVSELDTVTTTTTTDRFLYTVGNTSKAISYYRLGLRLATYGAISDSLSNRVNTWGVQTINGLKTFGDGFTISSGGVMGVPIAIPSAEGRLGRNGDSLMYRNSTTALALADKQMVRSLRYGNFLPLNSVGTATDLTYDLGSRTVRWDTIFVKNVSAGGGAIVMNDTVVWRAGVIFEDSTQVFGRKDAESTLDSIYVRNIYSPSGGGLTLTAPTGLTMNSGAINSVGNVLYFDGLIRYQKNDTANVNLSGTGLTINIYRTFNIIAASTSGVTIQGITYPPLGATDGDYIIILNFGAEDITLIHGSSNMQMRGGVNLVLSEGQTASFIWYGSNWYQL